MIAYLPSRRRLDLATGEADIALRMRNLPDSDDLVARSLGRMAFAVYARSADISTVIVPPEDPHLSQQAALIGALCERPHHRGADRRHADPVSGGKIRPRRRGAALLARRFGSGSRPRASIRRPRWWRTPRW